MPVSTFLRLLVLRDHTLSQRWRLREVPELRRIGGPMDDLICIVTGPTRCSKITAECPHAWWGSVPEGSCFFCCSGIGRETASALCRKRATGEPLSTALSREACGLHSILCRLPVSSEAHRRLWGADQALQWCLPAATRPRAASLNNSWSRRHKKRAELRPGLRSVTLSHHATPQGGVGEIG